MYLPDNVFVIRLFCLYTWMNDILSVTNFQKFLKIQYKGISLSSESAGKAIT